MLGRSRPDARTRGQPVKPQPETLNLTGRELRMHDRDILIHSWGAGTLTGGPSTARQYTNGGLTHAH
jgi:hypothetical protein